MEEMVKKLLELPLHERVLVTLVLTSGEGDARGHMRTYSRRTEIGKHLIPEVAEACRAGMNAAEGHAREEFLTDLFASLDVKVVA